MAERPTGAAATVFVQTRGAGYFAGSRASKTSSSAWRDLSIHTMADWRRASADRVHGTPTLAAASRSAAASQGVNRGFTCGQYGTGETSRYSNSLAGFAWSAPTWPTSMLARE